MANKAPEPIIIPFFGKGYVPNRFPLFNALQSVGVSVVKFQDSLIDGVNMEVSDLYSVDRRAAFTKWCSQQLNAEEVPLAFYSVRNLNGVVTTLADTNQNVYVVTPTSLTSILAKSTTNQAFIQQIGNIVYIADGTDLVKYDTITGITSPWGIAAPTVAPVIQQTRLTPGFWSQNTTYTLGQSLLDGNGNVEYATTGGNSDHFFPIWNTVLTGTVIDANMTWENVGALTSWVASTAYSAPTCITDTNGNIQLVTSAGTSGATVPTWNKTFGATTTDSGVTWTNIGPGTVNAYAGYSYVYGFRTVDGNLSTASPASVFTGPILNSVPITPINITSWSCTSNVVTFTAANTLSTGQQVTLNGFANSTFFNGQTVEVSSSGLSATAFEVSFTTPDASSTPENGTASPVICALTGNRSSNPECNSTATITNVSVSSNLVTVSCANNFAAGISIGFSGLTNATFLNGQTLFIETATPTQFTCPMVTPDYASLPDTGTATFLAVEIYRTDDGGGIYYFDNAVLNPTMAGSPSPFTGPTLTAGAGTNVAVPSGTVWTNPNNVTSASSYATVALSPPGAGGNPNFNIAQAGNNTAVGNTTTLTLPNPIHAGNTLLVSLGSFIRTDNGNFPPSLVSITDNLGNTYTTVEYAQGTYDGGSSQFFPASLWLFSAPVTVAGSCTITIVTSAPQAFFSPVWSIAGAEVSGMLTTVDAGNSVGNTCGGVSLNCGEGFHPVFYNTGTITTSTANDVIFSVVFFDTNPVSGIKPSGFTLAASNIVGGNNLGMAFDVVSSTGTFSPTWSANGTGNAVGLTAAFKLVTYGTASDDLQATMFGQAIPAGTAISGIAVEFDALNNGTTGDSTVFAQLLKNGAPVGNILSINPTTSNATYTLGGSTNLWGQTWFYSDFNNANWGVQLSTALKAQAGGPFTTSIRNVRATVYGETGLNQWAFYDIAADSALDNEEVAPLAHQNDPPPGAPGSIIGTGGTILAFWNGRVWMAVGNQLFFNGGPDITNGIKEECFPPANTWTFPGPITGLVPSAGGLVVTTSKEWWAILGGPQTTTFYPEKIFSNFGVLSPNLIHEDGGAIYVYTSQKQMYQVIGGNQNEIGFNIATDLGSGHATPSVTASAWNPSSSYLAIHRNGEDIGMYLSNGVESCLRFGLRYGNWSPIYQPLLNSSTPSLGAMGSVETSPGIFTLLAGDTQPGGYIYARNLTSFTDAGGAYDANTVVGNIVCAEMAQQMVPLHFITAYCAQTGNIPTVSFMPNEIAVTGTANFTPLPVVQSEAAFLPPSASLMAKRWSTLMNQQGTPILLKHVQVKFDFGSDTVKNQLFELGLRFDNTQMG